MPTPATRRPSLKIVTDLVKVKAKLNPLLVQEEDLKVQIRTYGAHAYSVDGGTVTVGEPEVRTFKGRILTVNQDVAVASQHLSKLVEAGILVWEDQYTRNAVAKVETKVNS